MSYGWIILFRKIDPFTADRTGDSNGVSEIMRREIMDFKIFWLSIHFARFLCVNILDCDEILTGPTSAPKVRIFCFHSF